MMHNFYKMFLRARPAFEFSHGLHKAVSHKPDRMFGSSGCARGFFGIEHRQPLCRAE